MQNNKITIKSSRLDARRLFLHKLPSTFFCQVKKISKIQEKLGSGWVGQAPTRISFLGGNGVFFVLFFFVVHVSKKSIKKLVRGVGWYGRGVGLYGLENLSFSQIVGIFLT